MNLATTIKKLNKGDQEAFRHLVYTYSGKLMVVAKIYTRNTEDAQDVMQDGFISIFQNIKKIKYTDEVSFLAWMKKIVMNEALQKYRRKSYQMEAYNLEFIEEQSIDPISFENFEREELIKAIYSLPLRFKQVVCLFALEGYSHKEIGKLLDIAPATSRSAYSRAKVMLQNKMNPTKIITKTGTNQITSVALAPDKKKCI